MRSSSTSRANTATTAKADRVGFFVVVVTGGLPGPGNSTTEPRYQPPDCSGGCGGYAAGLLAPDLGVHWACRANVLAWLFIALPFSPVGQWSGKA
jgi:hypothetical protein